jgi:hypothetical protein
VGCGAPGSEPAAPGDYVAFAVTLRFDEDCAGVWAVDGEGNLRWLVGRGGRAGAPAAFPTFRHDGRLAVGFFRGSLDGELPPIDVVTVEEGRTAAAEVVATEVAWAPNEAHVLALRGADLVRVETDTGRTTTIARDAGYQFTWLGEGKAIAFLAFHGVDPWLWTASADGSDARVLARGVERHLAASPDGRQIAFRRRAQRSLRHELWMVDVETGAQRRLPGPLLPDLFAFDDIWINRETLVVHDDRPGAGGEAPDAIRIDTASGVRSLLAPDTQVVQAARDGSLLLATRQPLLDVDETALAVLTMRPDGTHPRLLAVTDSGIVGETVPTLQPTQRELSRAEAAPSPEAERRCRSSLTALRERVSKG